MEAFLWLGVGFVVGFVACLFALAVEMSGNPEHPLNRYR